MPPGRLVDPYRPGKKGRAQGPGVAFQAPPGSQASSRGEAKDSALLSSRDAHQGCILSPCLFNIYAEYIMRNTGLDEAQAGIKTAGKNINNLR